MNWISPEEADNFIQARYGRYLPHDKLVSRYFSSITEVVDDETFSKLLRLAGAHPAEVPRVAAFVYGDPPRCVVHEDRRTQGTVLHEAMHMYRSTEFEALKYQSILEGSAEFFTREILGELSDNRDHYQAEYLVFEAIADRVGHEVLAKAYFGGDLVALKNAMEEVAGSGYFGMTFLPHMRRGKFDEILATFSAKG